MPYEEEYTCRGWRVRRARKIQFVLAPSLLLLLLILLSFRRRGDGL
jgi:hypothetical protein